jgi:hypothetical protein
MSDVLKIPVKIEMTIGEWNDVCHWLGEHPFNRVAPLINKIITQGRSQMAPEALPQLTNGALQPEAGHVPN